MSTECNYTVQLKDNGNLVRGTKNNIQTGGTNNFLNGAADAGRVQEIDYHGNVVMDFIYNTSSVLSHHDITLIGDNVLLTAWEVKTYTEINNADVVLLVFDTKDNSPDFSILPDLVKNKPIICIRRVSSSIH